MIRATLLPLILVAIYGNMCFSKPTTDVEENTIEDAGNNFRAQYAAQMLSYMNLSVQPCDDFYEYACGNWKNTIQERSTKYQRVNFDEITFQLTDVVGILLQKPDIKDIAPDYASEFEMAKKFYHNCLESDLYPMRKSSEYLKIVQSIGGFPAVDAKWNASLFNWFNMSAHLNYYGADSLIKELILDNYPFTPRFRLPVYGFDIELHNDTVTNTSSNAYQVNNNRMLNILSTYGVSKNESESIIAGIFEFLNAVLSMAQQFEESKEKCEKMSESLDSSAKDALTKAFTQKKAYPKFEFKIN